VWKVDGPTGYLCHINNAPNANYEQYWINPDTKPADVRYQGYQRLHGGLFPNTGGNPVNIPKPYDEIIDDIPSIYYFGVDGNFYRGDYIGNQDYGMFQPLAKFQSGGGGAINEIWKPVNLTPVTGLNAQWAAFDPSETGVSMDVNRVPKPGIVAFAQGAQNARGILGVYDSVNRQVLGMTNSWSKSGSRFCGIHTPLAFEGADQYSFVPYEDVIENYRVKMTSPDLPAAPDATSCAAQIAAIGQTNILNTPGSVCSTVTVNTITPYRPGTENPGLLGAIHLGDLFRYHTYGANDADTSQTCASDPTHNCEVMRVVAISGTTLVLHRDYTDASVGEVRGYQVHASGGWLGEFCTVTPRWWDYTTAPHGETSADLYSQNISGIKVDGPFAAASHYFTRGDFSLNDTGRPLGRPGFPCSLAGAPYSYRRWPWPNHLEAPDSAYGCTGGNPLFAGVNGAGEGNNLEKHPSPCYFLDVTPCWFDYRPLLTSSNDTQGTITKVAGKTYLYKVTGFNQFQDFVEKRHVLYAMSGHHPLRDVSGPGLPGGLLPDTAQYNYTYCAPHYAGECAAGSVAAPATGEVYVNAPYVVPVPGGGGFNSGSYKCFLKQGNPWAFELNDVCVQIQPSYANYAVQYSSDHDPENTGARRITNGLHQAKATGQSHTFPVLPNADWGITQGDGRILLTRIPPYPGRQRGTARNQWIPIPIRIGNVPVGTSNVVVRFGYNPNFWCSTRQEACIANAASITPTVYNYSTTDTYSGLACTSGCTPVIPALSQRVMWYRVEYRNGSNAIIKTGETEVLATP
jgi:hypothetical protein